jgi:hypothetical protein
MCGGNDFGREVQPVTNITSTCVPTQSSLDAPFTEVFNTFGGKDIVIPLPRELCLDETFGSQALHGLDDL